MASKDKTSSALQGESSFLTESPCDDEIQVSPAGLFCCGFAASSLPTEKNYDIIIRVKTIVKPCRRPPIGKERVSAPAGIRCHFVTNIATA
ncbi:hypothetical protein MRB53_040218 [Persea americana]|nr:hypothetical protein MRB53_040218 [Persea americana]